jgi:signal transduction histidine kinase
LDRLSAQASLIEPARTDVRFKEAGIPSEILPLVQKINEALARIDEGFELQRRFTSNAAHELRTPLAILRARIDGLDEGPAKQGLARDIDRMTRLVGQLLLSGRLEMPEAASVAPIDLGDIARETVERLRLLPASQGHPLHLELPETPIIVRGEAESLEDALRNLIDNAIAYSPTGSAVDIAVTQDAGLEVRDRGPGILAGDRQRIFERFWRGRKPTGEGAGLGLSIVKSIVTRHGGSVSIRDNPGGGTIFRLQFPTLSGDLPQPAALIAALDSRFAAGMTGGEPNSPRSPLAVPARPRRTPDGDVEPRRWPQGVAQPRDRN